jgi:hypothetical protein
VRNLCDLESGHRVIFSLGPPLTEEDIVFFALQDTGSSIAIEGAIKSPTSRLQKKEPNYWIARVCRR